VALGIVNKRNKNSTRSTHLFERFQLSVTGAG
jgi:hypothetical protein